METVKENNEIESKKLIESTNICRCQLISCACVAIRAIFSCILFRGAQNTINNRMVSRAADLCIAAVYVAIDFDECHKKVWTGNKSNFLKKRNSYYRISNNNKAKRRRKWQETKQFQLARNRIFVYTYKSSWIVLQYVAVLSAATTIYQQNRFELLRNRRMVSNSTSIFNHCDILMRHTCAIYHRV